MLGNKDNVEEVTKQYWVHPHQYIRKNIGELDEIMAKALGKPPTSYRADFAAGVDRIGY